MTVALLYVAQGRAIYENKIMKKKEYFEKQGIKSSGDIGDR